MDDNDTNSVIPASSDPTPEPDKLSETRFALIKSIVNRALAHPALLPIAIIVVTVALFVVFVLVLSGGAGDNADGYTNTMQGFFGECDNGGRAYEIGILVPLDTATTAASMEAWAPELDLMTDPERYLKVGYVQLDGCAIYALVDSSTGEYYAFIFKFDKQGAYAIGMSRTSLKDVGDLPNKKISVRPRQ